MRSILDKFRPLYEANGNGNGAVVDGQPPAPIEGQSNESGNEGNAIKAALPSDTVFSELDADSRKWMVDQGYATTEGVTPETAAKAYKQLRAQDKLIGASVRIPGKDATQEERDAFLAKLGRPETADAYEFAMPKDLPEGLPYDDGRAGEFKGVAHKLGLSKEQAAGLHDWFMANAANDFASQDSVRQEQLVASAKAEADKLQKVWGPLDGQTFKTNLELAHRFITEAGDDDVMPALQQHGIVSEDGMILDSRLAKLFAKAGATLYKEDGVLRGRADTLNNPFNDGKDNNETQQMQLIRSNRPYALSLIAAAGKKPSDFGLKD